VLRDNKDRGDFHAPVLADRAPRPLIEGGRRNVRPGPEVRSGAGRVRSLFEKLSVKGIRKVGESRSARGLNVVNKPEDRAVNGAWTDASSDFIVIMRT